MTRVIDTIRITNELRRHLGADALPLPGEGLLVILDPSEPTDVSDAAGLRATIERPDGSRIEREITTAEVRHGVAALYFQGLDAEEVPRLAKVSWVAGSRPAV